LKALNAALRKSVIDPEFIKRQEALGADVVSANDKRLDPAGHKTFVMAEVDKLGNVLKAAGQFAD
jgi:tripartite-type tricarboxylate transporter receptor subunit TctC